MVASNTKILRSGFYLFVWFLMSYFDFLQKIIDLLVGLKISNDQKQLHKKTINLNLQSAIQCCHYKKISYLNAASSYVADCFREQKKRFFLQVNNVCVIRPRILHLKFLIKPIEIISFQDYYNTISNFFPLIKDTEEKTSKHDIHHKREKKKENNYIFLSKSMVDLLCEKS
ncbi:hypothetical protein RFI_10484 [Reticulomyxa filosa]|uniref:Uncharacterized protein n=1 Tax=Reticulomyxa filosa TaxID=46433 RepID=X6NLP5_RETFI|nr:hypothetical protein RFI_10484 [Reticulomyxa filosa]|eukprot:ETO26654.1 hypothetical protein RFI_10484 [Reticulomyxa filosa]